MHSFTIVRALAALLFAFVALTAARPVSSPLPALRNLPRAVKGQIDYTRDLVDPILCPTVGRGACDAQCGLQSAGMTGRCDENGNCVCADGQGPIRETDLRLQS
ncbi:hypothetical protein DIS24_g12050 [Lasiodiplodia hormozganensis]|uniref:Invertebrate defensins family profile domain-containing protein n=2 Tax=Lasiodiplodia TaxID=66739 RepID=A0A5N5CUW6_9PEZI|nr:uncharacterized protein LTHEOB_6344 [Lasiodiplodia theobromae]KAB2569135.1 hypothetical protein DBV05_g12184 [Lasiodiplodia theobromae]KAF4544226.1 hypothetical protein LTHEOB_6344 [Lasiodiplodia theobromae]KAK0610322.1 hypothetical protein DIS24_g12050 [Lasiodiplodia hormozganensis]